MQRYTSLEKLHRSRFPPGLLDVLTRAVEGELAIARSSGKEYDPDATGGVWLLEEGDGDIEVTAVFGLPLTALPFERVRHNPGNWFLCYLVRNNSRCDTVVIPDAPWLAAPWRTWLTSQP